MVAAQGRVRPGGIRRAQPAAVRPAVPARCGRERLLALLSPGASPGSIRLGVARHRTQHIRIRDAVVRQALQQGHLPHQRGLGLPLLVADSRRPPRRQVAADRRAARRARLRRTAGLHGVQRLHPVPLRPAGHASRRRPDARERVDLRARHLGADGAPVRRRRAGRRRRPRRAGGALSRHRLALGRRTRTAARNRGLDRRQPLLRALALVVRRRAGRSDHPAPGEAPALQLAAVAGRAGHRRGARRLCRGGGGPPGRDDAGTPSRPLLLRGRIVRCGTVGRRRLSLRTTGSDAPVAERAGRAAASHVHALRILPGARRRVLDEHGVGVERNTDGEPLGVLGLEANGRPLSPSDCLPEASRLLHAGSPARRHLGGGHLRLRRT